MTGRRKGEAVSQEANVRLEPPLWRHDAYALRMLKAAILAEVRSAAHDGVLRAGESTVVDLGAGSAPYRPLFAPVCRRYVACDLEPGDGIDVVVESGREVPFPTGTADMVVSFQVLEHVWDLDWYLGECKRLLSERGRLLLSTHGTWLYHPHPTDYRRWTRDGLCRELELRGFDVTGVRGVVGPWAWTTQFRAYGYRMLLSRFGRVGDLGAKLLNPLLYGRMVLEDAVTPPGLRETNAAVYLVSARPKR
jgi:SAM-dependent methyltransferase